MAEISNPPGATLADAQPEEIRLPVPWGHIAAKVWRVESCSPTSTAAKFPVLALHGWMDNAGSFDRLAPLLSSQCHLVAVDFPGHGLSSHLPPGVPAHFGDFLIALRRIPPLLNWRKFALLGHSMGGALAALYAALFPAQVDRLLMLDIVKPMTRAEGATPGEMSQAIDLFLEMEGKVNGSKGQQPEYEFSEALQRQIAGSHGGLTEESARCLLARGAQLTPREKYAFRRDLRLRCPTMYPFTHDSCLDFIRAVKCPTLIVKAKQAPVFDDVDVVQRALQIYRENCKTFKYVEVDGGHFVHLNQPELVAPTLNKFILDQCGGNCSSDGDQAGKKAVL